MNENNMRKDFETLPSDALKDYYNRNYVSAHEKYEWYFENSEKLKPSLRGVRVSFCLSGWVDVAKEYPPAMKRIVEIKKDALNDFNEKQSVEAFRDFSCISRYLRTGNEVLELFYNCHQNDKEMAKKIFRHVYEFLVDIKEWDVCAEYMYDFSRKYNLSFHVFDHTSKSEHELDKELAELTYQNRVKLLRKGIIPIFKILSTKLDSSLYNQYIEKVKTDLERRDLNELFSDL